MSKLVNYHTEKYVDEFNKLFNDQARIDKTAHFKKGMEKSIDLLEKRINKCKSLKEIARVTVKFITQCKK